MTTDLSATVLADGLGEAADVISQSCSGSDQGFAEPAIRKRRVFEDHRQVVERLTGQMLPPVELPTFQAVLTNLRHHLDGRVVIYLLPGLGYGDEDDSDDLAEHDGYRLHRHDFEARHISIIGISSISTNMLLDITRKIDHLMLADPELLLAQALDLPTVLIGNTVAHCRLTLVVHHGRISKVFYPVTSPGRNAIHVIACMQAVGWW